MNFTLYFYLLIIAGYLVGSINFAIVVCKIFRLPDPRTVGSNNPGATNVMRIGGKLPAVLTLFGDFGKSIAVISVGMFLELSEMQLLLIGFMCFIGHLYPIFRGFKEGGKGVATFLGIILIISPITGISVSIAWLIIAKLTKLSALAAIISIPLSPFIYYVKSQNIEHALVLAIMCLLLVWRHKSNIKNMMTKI